MFEFLKRKKQGEKLTDNPEITVETEPIEVFMNSREDKCGELYYKNGCFSYLITEKLFDDFEGRIRYYWCPVQTTASFFDTREKAIAEIMTIIETKE